MDWLQFSSCDWNKFTGYQKFSHFVLNVAVVNDGGERGVKGIQEVVSKTKKEDLRQNMLLSNAEERKQYPNKGATNDTKKNLAKI